MPTAGLKPTMVLTVTLPAMSRALPKLAVPVALLPRSTGDKVPASEVAPATLKLPVRRAGDCTCKVPVPVAEPLLLSRFSVPVCAWLPSLRAPENVTGLGVATLIVLGPPFRLTAPVRVSGSEATGTHRLALNTSGLTRLRAPEAWMNPSPATHTGPGVMPSLDAVPAKVVWPLSRVVVPV